MKILFSAFIYLSRSIYFYFILNKLFVNKIKKNISLMLSTRITEISSGLLLVIDINADYAILSIGRINFIELKKN